MRDASRMAGQTSEKGRKGWRDRIWGEIKEAGDEVRMLAATSDTGAGIDQGIHSPTRDQVTCKGGWPLFWPGLPSINPPNRLLKNGGK
jgi:hypothetical protein